MLKKVLRKEKNGELWPQCISIFSCLSDCSCVAHVGCKCSFCPLWPIGDCWVIFPVSYGWEKQNGFLLESNQRYSHVCCSVRLYLCTVVLCSVANLVTFSLDLGSFKKYCICYYIMSSHICMWHHLATVWAGFSHFPAIIVGSTFALC